MDVINARYANVLRWLGGKRTEVIVGSRQKIRRAHISKSLIGKSVRESLSTSELDLIEVRYGT